MLFYSFVRKMAKSLGNHSVQHVKLNWCQFVGGFKRSASFFLQKWTIFNFMHACLLVYEKHPVNCVFKGGFFIYWFEIFRENGFEFGICLSRPFRD